MDCFPSRSMHLAVTKSTTHENYAACHKIMQPITNLKPNYIDCCWDVPANFNTPTTFSAPSGPFGII